MFLWKKKKEKSEKHATNSKKKTTNHPKIGPEKRILEI